VLASTDPAIREALAAYEIEAVIGRGSWGVVMKARHRQLGREVAVKQLPTEFASQEEVRRRFVNEARLLAGLDHPHIVPVYDFIEKEGVCLLIMEYLPGGTVWGRFNQEGFDYLDSCAIALATCAALHFAHGHGVLHRDIKPENLMFTGQGILKVTDFGIAKVLGAASTMGTRAGEVLGSPAYIAPEQATGSELGPFTDVYATAVVLYELLSGQLPFPDDGDPLMVMYRHVHESPMPLSEVAPEVPAPLAEVVMHGLATDKANRYQTAEEFGVAVARAATASFGPGWLQRASVMVMGGGPIIAATERPLSPGVSLAPQSRQPPDRLPVESGAPALALAPDSAGAPPGPSQSAGGVPGAAPQATPGGAGAAGLPLSVSGSTPGLQEAHPYPGVAAPPAAGKVGAKILLGAALAALATALILAALGLPHRARPVSPNSRGLVVQGKVPQNGAVEVDFDRPVDVRIPLPGPESEFGPADSASSAPPRLLATVSLPGGFSVSVASQRSFREGAEAVFVFEGRQFKYLVAGKSTVHFRLESPGLASIEPTGRDARAQILGSVQFKPARWAPLAIPTVASALGLLALLAYAEALLIPLRRGNRRGGAVAGLTVVGLLAGVCFSYLGWSLQIAEPSAATLWSTSVLSGVAALLAGLWGLESHPRSGAA
jgi:tRNA A-37 threonylcarbamoyl transferase component Bud32